MSRKYRRHQWGTAANDSLLVPELGEPSVRIAGGAAWGSVTQVQEAIMPSDAKHPRVLVVEDEFFIGLRIADLLQCMGCDVVGPLGTVARASAEADREPIDAALLDVRLRDETVVPVAEILNRRRIPFALVTASAPDHLPASLLDRPYVPKPFTDEDIKTAVRNLLQGADADRSSAAA
jgi:DNA-binding response OmpR family regulator